MAQFVTDQACLLSGLIQIKEVAGTHLQGAGELEDVIEADVLLSSFHGTDKVPVYLDHLAQLFLGNATRFAQGTEAFAER